MLTSRERVARAIAHQDTDRVPMRYNGRVEVDKPLAEMLGIPIEGDWFERLMQRLEIDVRNVHPGAKVPPEIATPKGDLPMLRARTPADVRRLWPPELEAEYRDFDSIAAKARALDAAGEPRWISMSTGSIFTQTTKMIGNEATLIGIGDEDPTVLAMFDENERFLTGLVERALAAFGGRLDMIYIGDDLGIQQSLFASPAALRKHLFPRYKRIGDRIHAGGAKYFFHCCGAIHDIIPDFIAAGVDVMNPIQPCVADMAPEILQRDFGGQVTFCGGIDMQRLLPFGTPEEVAREVERYCRVLGARGGYILDSANILHTDVPSVNIETMFRTAREWRWDK